MPDLDFSGFAEQTRAVFKPEYADVVARARRRRRNVRTVGAVITVLALIVGGAAIHGLSGRPVAEPTRPKPVPSYIQIGPQGMSPKPTYTLIDPKSHVWDVTVPDKPLTGLFPRMLAGDMNHLYLEYQDCKGSICTGMFAASADRGRTWQKRRLPSADGKYGSLMAAYGATLVARSDVLGRRRPGGGAYMPTATYFASIDGGITWRASKPRVVAALPAGWPLIDSDPGTLGVLTAYDPATGDIAEWHADQGAGLAFTLVSLPRAAGIWQIRTRPIRSSPSSTTGTSGPTWESYLAVSRDGGVTWQDRTLPDVLSGNGGAFGSVEADSVVTVDGKTVVTAVKDGDKLRLYVSHDGAATWKAGAEIAPHGPMLSILPTRDGPILFEAGTSAYRSTDGGATLQYVGPALGSWPRAVPGGYAEDTNDGRFSIWLSTDGGTWTFVPRPQVP